MGTRYYNLGFETQNYILSSGPTFWTIIFSIAFHICLLVVWKLLQIERPKKKLHEFVLLFYWSYYVRYWIEGALELTMNALLNLLRPRFNNFGEILSVVFSVLTLFCIIFFPFVFSYITILKTYLLDDETAFMKRFGGFYE